MKLELNNKTIDKNIKSIEKNLSKIEKKNKKELDNYLKESRENLKYIVQTAIDRFYEDYEPHFYGRAFDLYHVYKINVDENGWNIDFSPDFMKAYHRVSHEYIFENSFINGYHGGATSGYGHPDPGTPYWRNPSHKTIMDLNSLRSASYEIYFFKKGDDKWLRPAIKSPSPYNEIRYKAKDYMDLAYEKYMNEYNARMNDFYSDVKRKLERII